MIFIRIIQSKTFDIALGGYARSCLHCRLLEELKRTGLTSSDWIERNNPTVIY